MSYGRSSRRTRAPLTARLVDEVAAVHVERAGEVLLRVGDGVHGVVAEDDDVAGLELLAAGLGERAPFVVDAPVERVVLLARVDADGRPHQVVVRIELHVRRPDDVQHRQLRRVVDHPEPALLRLQRVGDLSRPGERLVQQFLDRPAGLRLRAGVLAGNDEVIEIEHRPRIAPRPSAVTLSWAVGSWAVGSWAVGG